MRTIMAALACLGGCGRYGFVDRVDGNNDDAAAASDAADAEPDAAEVRCGSREVLAESFDDATAGPFFMSFPAGGVPIVQTGSAVEFQLTNTASGEYGSYASVSIPAGDACVVLEVLDVPTPSLGGAAYIKLIGTQEQIEFYYRSGDVEARYRVGGTLQNPVQFPWDPVETRYWRFVRIGAGTRWQTSADGVSYVDRLSQPSITVTGIFHLEFGAGANSPLVGDGGKARFGSALVLQN